MHKQELRTQLLSRVAAHALAVSLAVVTTFGVRMADTVLKQRDFEGQIKLSICGPDAKGKSEVKDTLTASIRFPFTVADVASGKVVRMRLSGAGAGTPFSLTDVPVGFGVNSSALVLSIEPEGKVPPLQAQIKYTGTGRLLGRWEIVMPVKLVPNRAIF
jgi:hypothetical protein